MSELLTVKIKNPRSSGGYLIINAADFDSAVHAKFRESEPGDEEPMSPIEPMPPAPVENVSQRRSRRP